MDFSTIIFLLTSHWFRFASTSFFLFLCLISFTSSRESFSIHHGDTDFRHFTILSFLFLFDFLIRFWRLHLCRSIRAKRKYESEKWKRIKTHLSRSKMLGRHSKHCNGDATKTEKTRKEKKEKQSKHISKNVATWKMRFKFIDAIKSEMFMRSHGNRNRKRREWKKPKSETDEVNRIIN